MKKIIFLFFLTTIIGCSHGQDISKWSVNLKVTDDNGQPVSGARASVAYGESAEETVAGLTDANGVFYASHGNNHSFTLGLRIEKEGYYPIGVVYELAGRANSTPNLNLAWTLKKISKPIPMYAKSVNLGMPVFDKPVAFDFEIGDWIAPYGKGINKDIIFTGHFDSESNYTLTVSFPSVGDGIQEFNVPNTRFPGDGSALRSVQEAPADGYQPQWVQTDNRAPGKPIQTNRDPNRNYYFRIHTKLDENGNVISAHYGKIYGDFMQFRYYYNPTPNDRDVEFNSKQNLLGGLKSFERVTAP